MPLASAVLSEASSPTLRRLESDLDNPDPLFGVSRTIMGRSYLDRDEPNALD